MADAFADVSHHQSIDLAAYFAAHDLLALKVTEATGYVDPTFPARYAYARAYGHPVVLYHFDRARFDGADQWDWFEAAIRAAGGPRPWPLDLPCLDSEDTNYPAGATASALAFTGRAVARGFTQGSAYSGRWFAGPNGIRLDMLPPGWQRGWLSDYTAGHADATMPLPPGWPRERIIARQWTSTKTDVPGVAGECDYSRILRPWITEEEDVSADDVWNQQIPVPPEARQLFVHPSYSAADFLVGQAVRAARLEQTAAVQGRQIAALSGTVTALSRMLAEHPQQPLTADQIEAAAKAGADEALRGTLHIEVTVDQPDSAPEPTEGATA